MYSFDSCLAAVDCRSSCIVTFHLVSGLTASQRAWKPGTNVPFLNPEQVSLRESTIVTFLTTSHQIQTYKKQGFLVVTGFYSPAECQNMRDAMASLTAAYDPTKDEAAIFETGAKQVTQVHESVVLQDALVSAALPTART
jgi:hypothetical protein